MNPTRIVRKNTPCKDLKALVSKALENTNWKLMSDGITYRMGILKGRIRGMEKEKDLLKHVHSLK